MSDAIYPTRLRWHHNIGVARHDGVCVELRAAPVLPGAEGLTEVDYVPTVIAQVRIGCDAMRDMTAHERVSAQALLIRMAAEVRGVVA